MARQSTGIAPLDDFLDYCLIEEGLTPATITTYRQVLHAFCTWAAHACTAERFVPELLTRDLLRGWQHHLIAERRLDTATYVKYVSALRSFLAYLHEERLTELTRDDVRLPKGYLDLSSVKALTLEELTALVQAPDPRTPWGRRDRALLALLYSTGMRIAELCSLNRSHIPLERLCRGEVLELPIVGKGRKPRVVFVDRLAQELLKVYLESRDDDLVPLFRPYRGRPNAEGRLTPRMIQRAIDKYAKKAGLVSSPTPHTLRHSFAVHKLQAGADTRIVQAFLGHASLATTQRYTRVTDRYLREAYERAHRSLVLRKEALTPNPSPAAAGEGNEATG
jgi:integrase/recombinase XerD